MTAAIIVGLQGTVLTSEEADFLAETQPMGVILFARNISHSDQIIALVDDAKTALARDDVLILIDQEGGRVQRIRSPLAHDLPPASAFAALYQRDRDAAMAATRHVGELCGAELRAFGINMNCAPVLDTPVVGAHDIIGNRAFGDRLETIVTLGTAFAEGLMATGVVPVIKHIPGHGRATADSHLALPRVDTDHATLSRTDFAPFKALAHMPAAMTAHVVFSAIDDGQPATTSATVNETVVRGEIGFDGLLMSDDLSMRALSGTMAERTRAVFSGGCDVALHCNGNLKEMRAAAAETPALSAQARRRFARCIEIAARPPIAVSDAARTALSTILDDATLMR